MGVASLKSRLQSGCFMEELLEPQLVDLMDGDEEQLIVLWTIA
jgi:hypothetical protein